MLLPLVSAAGRLVMEYDTGTLYLPSKNTTGLTLRTKPADDNVRLAEIANDEISDRSSLMPSAEAEFDAACRAIESGDWDEAYEMLDLLARDTLPSELSGAAGIMSDILDPIYSPNETVEKISQSLMGRAFRVYHDHDDWYEEAMRQLSEVERDLFGPSWELLSETDSRPFSKS